MYEIIATKRYCKDVKKLAGSGKDLQELHKVINVIAAGKILPPKYKDHQLKEDFVGYRECHIEPDWLLIYKLDRNFLILTLVRTGSHSNLF